MMKFVSKIMILIGISIFFLTPVLALAEEAAPVPIPPKPANAGKEDKNKTIVQLINPISGEDPIKGTTNLQQIVGKAIANVLGILGSLALLVFVYGGFMWVTAAGNAEKVKQGSDAMLWAVIGICIIFSSYAILKLVFKGIGAGNTTADSLQVYCVDMKTNQCAIMSGNACAGIPYDSQEACDYSLTFNWCFVDGVCQENPATNCLANGGTPLPDEASCKKILSPPQN